MKKEAKGYRDLVKKYFNEFGKCENVIPFMLELFDELRCKRTSEECVSGEKKGVFGSFMLRYFLPELYNKCIEFNKVPDYMLRSRNVLKVLGDVIHMGEKTPIDVVVGSAFGLNEETSDKDLSIMKALLFILTIFADAERRVKREDCKDKESVYLDMNLVFWKCVNCLFMENSEYCIEMAIICVYLWVLMYRNGFNEVYRDFDRLYDLYFTSRSPILLVAFREHDSDDWEDIKTMRVAVEAHRVGVKS